MLRKNERRIHNVKTEWRRVITPLVISLLKVTVTRQPRGC
jgi:hypothetical protein